MGQGRHADGRHFGCQTHFSRKNFPGRARSCFVAKSIARCPHRHDVQLLEASTVLLQSDLLNAAAPHVAPHERVRPPSCNTLVQLTAVGASYCHPCSMQMMQTCLKKASCVHTFLQSTSSSWKLTKHCHRSFTITDVIPLGSAHGSFPLHLSLGVHNPAIMFASVT